MTLVTALIATAPPTWGGIAGIDIHSLFSPKAKQVNQEPTSGNSGILLSSSCHFSCNYCSDSAPPTHLAKGEEWFYSFSNLGIHAAAAAHCAALAPPAVITTPATTAPATAAMVPALASAHLVPHHLQRSHRGHFCFYAGNHQLPSTDSRRFSCFSCFICVIHRAPGPPAIRLTVSGEVSSRLQLIENGKNLALTQLTLPAASISVMPQYYSLASPNPH